MSDPRSYWNNRYSSGEPTRASGTFVHSEAANRWFYRAKQTRIEEILRRSKIDLTNKSVLDAACGTGAFIPFWLKLGATTVQGIDLSDKAAEACRKKFAHHSGCRFQRVDLSSNEPGNQLGSFDLVCIFEAIFLLTKETDFVTALGNLCSWVKPGGFMLISDHFPDVTLPRHERLTYHSRATYETVFARHGVQILSLFRQSCAFNRHLLSEQLQTRVENFCPWSLYLLDRLLLRSSGNHSSYVDEVYYCLARRKPPTGGTGFKPVPRSQ